MAPGGSGGDSATLVINSDSCYCSACGGGASIEERQHLTLLPREVMGGWVQPPLGQRAGCGLTFIATATDSFLPAVADGIRVARPDLPFVGMYGAQGEA